MSRRKKASHEDRDAQDARLEVADRLVVLTIRNFAFHTCLEIQIFVFEQGDTWRQLAMGQSLEDGTLAFFHRGTKGSKTGSDGELNPIRRYWPTFLSSPITGSMGGRIFGWDSARDMLTFNKDAVEGVRLPLQLPQFPPIR